MLQQAIVKERSKLYLTLYEIVIHMYMTQTITTIKLLKILSGLLQLSPLFSSFELLVHLNVLFLLVVVFFIQLLH